MVLAAAKRLRRSVNAKLQGLFFDKLIENVRNRGPIADSQTLFNYMARGNFGVISAIQARDEIIPVLDFIRKNPPATLVEIGTANGGTLFMFTRVARPDATIISLDLPGGKWGGGYGEERVPLYEAFALPDQTMHLVRADSHQPESLDKLRGLLGDRKIDFLFIDGDHDYEGVKQDFEMYAPLVAPGGLIGFHDIVYAPGVKQFWNEVKPRFQETHEFISSSERVFGIALARVPA